MVPAQRWFRGLAALLAAASMAILTENADANVRLPKVFGSNMVLQRDRDLPIWGWADPGEEVTVTLGEAKVTAKTEASGRWKAMLPPQKAGGPHQVTVAGKNQIVLSDVLIGEVWVCSGQSNMEWSVAISKDGGKEIAAAKHPMIRLFHIPKVPAGKPVEDVVADWKVCDPSTIPQFSAVAYYFGRTLNQELNVPIGLINTSWGGTRIEPWTPPVGFKAVEKTANIAQQVEQINANFEKQKKATLKQFADWLTAAQKAGDEGTEIPAPPAWPTHPLNSSGAPTGLYNGMIHPIVPFAIRGAIWYQGESNLTDGMLYHEKMKALISGWRSVWNQGDFPFYYVHLAPYRYNQPWEKLAELWEAQSATLSVPNTGMAVITDIGNLADIHPNNKQDVGKRLALWALAKTYDKSGVVYSGPMFKSAAPKEGSLVVQFASATGLKTTDGKAPNWFEVAGADGKYAPADAKIDGETVILSAKSVPEPKSVRYGWTESQTPNLVNESGLPAVPFRHPNTPAK